jgi:hypothetical protein
MMSRSTLLPQTIRVFSGTSERTPIENQVERRPSSERICAPVRVAVPPAVT